MKIIEIRETPAHTQYFYDDKSVITDFHTIVIYFNPNTITRIEYRNNIFILEQEAGRKEIPDLVKCTCEEFFQYTTLYDTYVLKEIQGRIKGIARKKKPPLWTTPQLS